jgi:putative ABC transport system permease protein
MSIWHISWGYLWSRKITTFLTIFSVALGVAMISAILTLRYETERRFDEEGRAFEIVAGAKGSPLQLVLSALYFMDNPTGNITWDDYERIKAMEDVESAYPIGLGDTMHGGGQAFRIVGATRELMDFVWVHTVSEEKTYPFELAEGRYFESPMEAVLGAFVARASGLQIGDTFIGSHGVMGFGSHDDHPFTVVGILQASDTPFDRAALCSLESIWEIHEEHDEPDGTSGDATSTAVASTETVGPMLPQTGAASEANGDHHSDEPKRITAVLAKLTTPAAQFQVKDIINKEFNAMAAIPVMEVMKFYFQFLATAQMILMAVAYIVVIISAITIMIGLYLAIFQRRRDLAVMRALGAAPTELFGIVLVESLLVTLLGVGTGFVLGGAVSFGFGQYLEANYGLNIRSFLLTTEHLTCYGTVLFFGLAAGVFPARQAYYTEVAANLAEL